MAAVGLHLTRQQYLKTFGLRKDAPEAGYL